MPEQGRIRTGIKGPKGWPQAIDTFRFTSVDEEAINEIADLYGGTPRPWSDKSQGVKNQFEVITTTNAIRVVLPSESVDIGYELWEGAARKRLCDGAECQLPDSEIPVPCMCVAAGALACDYTTRARVILPDVRFGGVWRYQSKSQNVFRELNTMADFIEMLNANTGGAIEATMRLENRTSRKIEKGKTVTFHYNVVTFSISHSPDQLLLGAAAYGGPQAISSGQESDDIEALGQGTTPPESVGEEPSAKIQNPIEKLVEVFDAEIIEDGWKNKNDIPADVKASGVTFDKEAKLWRAT
jgi:hypothetical protein